MVEPTKEELFGAVSAFLLKEDNMSPKDMKAKILEEHPDWKVSERRVKKYIKRHSNGLKLSDMDDDSTAVSQGTKSKSFMKRLFLRKRKSSQKAPISVIEEGMLHSVSETDMEEEVKTTEAHGATAEDGKILDEKVYEEGDIEGEKDCECAVCVIS